ncbi:MAG TPA: GyrI-like domain-containing protein, partial [Candidatus Agathobaculum stercoravium]|nr:GyrI-like domain-containing protein [Candidatus Agathobaculum stercoravium]
MLQYEVVTLPAKKVAGLKIRTGNADPACPDKIGGLWERLMGTDAYRERMHTEPDAVCYGLYTNYGWDDE